MSRVRMFYLCALHQCKRVMSCIANFSQWMFRLLFRYHRTAKGQANLIVEVSRSPCEFGVISLGNVIVVAASFLNG